MMFLILNRTRDQAGQAYARDLSRRIHRLTIAGGRPEDGQHYANHLLHPDGRVALMLPEAAEHGAQLTIHAGAVDELSPFADVSQAERGGLAANIQARRGKTVRPLDFLPASKLGSLKTAAQMKADGWWEDPP